MYLIFKIYEGWWDAMNIKRFCWVIPTWNLETAHMYEKEWVKFHKSGNFKKTMPAQILPTFQIQFGFFCSNKAIAACIVLNHYQFNGTHRVTHCLVIIWNIPSPRSFWTNTFLTYMYVKKEKPFVYRPFSQIMACKQHSHNAIVHLNFQKYSVKILYAIMDWVCLGQPKQSIVGYSSTCPFMAMTWPRKWILYKYC